MPEVGQHHILGLGRHLVVKRDRQALPGKWIHQVGGGPGPATGEGGHLEHRRHLLSLPRRGFPDEHGRAQRRLVGQGQGGRHHPLDRLGSQAQLLDAVVQLASQLGDALP